MSIILRHLRKVMGNWLQIREPMTLFVLVTSMQQSEATKKVFQINDSDEELPKIISLERCVRCLKKILTVAAERSLLLDASMLRTYMCMFGGHRYWSKKWNIRCSGNCSKNLQVFMEFILEIARNIDLTRLFNCLNNIKA